MTTAPMVPLLYNGRWRLLVPEHRAAHGELETGWERARLDDMAERIGPGDVVFDVGAEEGDFPALYSTWGAEVLAVEPMPAFWPNIRAVWEANALDPLIAWFVGFASEVSFTPRRCDVAEPYGTDGWPACAEGPVSGGHGFKHLSQEADTTAQIRLDDLAARCGVRPTAITIDSEGSEERVLRGATTILSEDRPIVWVSIHIDRPWMNEQYDGVGRSHIYALMESFGYEGTLLAIEHEEHHRFQHPGRR